MPKYHIAKNICFVLQINQNEKLILLGRNKDKELLRKELNLLKFTKGNITMIVSISK